MASQQSSIGNPALQAALEQARTELQQFANDLQFQSKMEQAFGKRVDVSNFQNAWEQGEFESLPALKIRSAEDLNNAQGAYAAETETIYLAQEFLNEGSAGTVARVFLEEYGHYLDDHLNNTEMTGDEGALFSRFALGKTPSKNAISELQTENDITTVDIDGQKIAIEQFFHEDLDLGESIQDAFNKLSNKSQNFLQSLESKNIINATTDLTADTINSIGNQIEGFSQDVLDGVSDALANLRDTVVDLAFPEPNSEIHIAITPGVTGSAAAGVGAGAVVETGIDIPIVFDTDIDSFSDYLPVFLATGSVASGFQAGLKGGISANGSIALGGGSGSAEELKGTGGIVAGISDYATLNTSISGAVVFGGGVTISETSTPEASSKSIGLSASLGPEAGFAGTGTVDLINKTIGLNFGEAMSGVISEFSPSVSEKELNNLASFLDPNKDTNVSKAIDTAITLRESGLKAVGDIVDISKNILTNVQELGAEKLVEGKPAQISEVLKDTGFKDFVANLPTPTELASEIQDGIPLNKLQISSDKILEELDLETAQQISSNISNSLLDTVNQTTNIANGSSLSDLGTLSLLESFQEIDLSASTDLLPDHLTDTLSTLKDEFGTEQGKNIVTGLIPNELTEVLSNNSESKNLIELLKNKNLGFTKTSNTQKLVNVLAVDNSGISIKEDSIGGKQPDGASSILTTNQPEENLGILLTSGDGIPPLENTSDSFHVDNDAEGDPALDQVAKNAFSDAGETFDANTLKFNYTVEDSNVDSIQLDLLFGSDEFPEFSNSSYVDAAGVFVGINGKNVAFFDGDSSQPLSVIDSNLDAGNFIDNKDGQVPIEYDGISSPLTITAPVEQGQNTIKIGVADTGDHIYDSGLFLSGLQTSKTSSGGGGVKLDVPGTDSNDDLSGSDKDELIEGLDGNDSIAPGSGNDIVEAGPGNDIVQGSKGDNQINGGPGFDKVSYSTSFSETPIEINQNTVTVGSNTDTLTNVESLEFSDKLTSSSFLDTLSLSAANAEKQEGDDGIATYTFTVTRPDNVTGELAFNYAVGGSGDHPADAEDFGGNLPTGTVTFTGEETEKQINIDVTGDSQVEANEEFTLTLSSSEAGEETTSPTATSTVLNDDLKVANPVTNQQATEDGLFDFQLPKNIFSAPDNNSLTLSASFTDGSELPDWLSFDANNRTFSGTPGEADDGSLELQVTASNEQGAKASSSFALNVAEVNDPPEVANPLPEQQVIEDEAVSFQVPGNAFSDPDDTNLSLNASRSDGSELPAWLSFNAEDRTFSGTPGEADDSSLELTVTASDAEGATASSSFALNVAEVNDSPEAVNPLVEQQATEDEAFSFRVPENAFSDPDDANLSLSASRSDGSELPAWLSFNAEDRTFSGTPGHSHDGRLELQVMAKDSQGATQSSEFNLTVAEDFNLDVDGNGTSDALTDGILAVRYLFGFQGQDLTQGALGEGATRTEPDKIASFLQDNGGSLDIDGNGETDALTDGILLTRALFGFEDQALTQGAIGEGAERTQPSDIADHVAQNRPEQAASSSALSEDLSHQMLELAPQPTGSQLDQSAQASVQAPGTEHSLQPRQEVQSGEGLEAI